MNRKIELPINVKFIMDTLWDNGYDSYVVGGCVRDSILERNPNDWDITTEAEPDEIIKLFDKVILTGVKHGTVTVIIDKEAYEVTTYRFDGEYEDGRHPQQVKFVKDLKEDLARRDFTINAIAYNERKGIVDYFGGIQDLNNKIIRTVGDSEKRFSEDALRMIRAVRFSLQLNFDIEKNTFKSIKTLAVNINKISKERIRDEFNKIILTDFERWKELVDTNLLEYILPEMKESYTHINENIFLPIKDVEKKIYLRLTMFIYKLEYMKNNKCSYNGKGNETLVENTKEILKTLRYDNETIKKVSMLITYYNYEFSEEKSIKRLLNKIGYDLTKNLIEIKTVNSFYEKKEKVVNFSIIEEQLNRIITEKQCFLLKNLNISGKDLINIGFEKGKKIGEILEYLLNEVIEDRLSNDKAELIRKSKELLDR